MSEEKNYYHNKGEQDAKKGVFIPPDKPMIMELIGGSTDKEIEDSKQYRKGWINTKDQKEE